MVTPKTGIKLFHQQPTISLSILTLIASFYSCSSLSFQYQWNQHNLDFEARTRMGMVDVAAANDARAGSILLRTHFTSRWTSTLRSEIEIDHVNLFWEDDFTNGVNFNNKPVVPDVAGTDLNQFFVSYELNNTLSVSLGREAYNLSNQRMVGTNGFWQNEQSFDGAGMRYEFASASHVQYHYIANANRINGDDADKQLDPGDINFVTNNGLRPAKFLGDHEHDTHLLFAQFKEWDFSVLQAYYLDMDIKDALALSNRTIGIRYEHKGRTGKLRTLGHAELALQTRNEVSDNTSYLYQSFAIGAGYGPSEISVNYERLGENKDKSFVTPLASLHDKNGWADKFLLTPNSGLRDYSLKYIWRKSPIKVDGRYHLFYTDVNQSAIGTEVDLDVEYKFANKQSFLLRLANFESLNDQFTSENRTFLMYHYHF